VRAWEAELRAFHATDGCSNGPTEAVNLLVKKVKGAGHGFRDFANHRLLLLHCGIRWQTHRTQDCATVPQARWRSASTVAGQRR
jgi:hypothetical protein